MVFAIPAAVAVRGVVLADADRRHDTLAFADVHDAHAARAASGDAHSVDRTADQGSAVGDQHDLIALQHGERRHDLSALGEIHQLHALAAAAGHTIFERRRALAEAR